MLKGSGKYRLQRPDRGDISGFYQCVGMDQQAKGSFSDTKLFKKRLVDHYIMNVGGGNLDYNLQPQLSKSAAMLRESTGVNSQDVLCDETS